MTYRRFQKVRNKIYIIIRDYISDNYNNLIDLNICKFKNKYYYKNDLLKNINENNSKEYIKIDKNKYVRKDKLINVTYMYIKCPKKFIKLDLQSLIIIPINNGFKIFFSYENKIEEKKEIQKNILNPDKSISIDLGVKNLMFLHL
jgi:hypothetical protein